MIGALRRLSFLLGIIAGSSLTGGTESARAHPPAELDRQLDARETYFQALDRPAPKFALLDAEGRPVSLDDLAGKVVVLNFIYTHCPDVCPLHAEKIAAVQGLVNRTAMRDHVRFVTITTDPARDTSDVLRAYGSQHALDPANWVFLTSGPGRPDATRRLAKAFGHRFVETSDGLQMHGVVTHVIDQSGRLSANFYGLDFDDANLVLFVNALANHEHPSAGSDPGSVPTTTSYWTRLRSVVLGW
jgi:protein SCO1/2